jgi:hypothetical protein
MLGCDRGLNKAAHHFQLRSDILDDLGQPYLPAGWLDAYQSTGTVLEFAGQIKCSFGASVTSTDRISSLVELKEVG